jgi:hypothetical protein
MKTNTEISFSFWLTIFYSIPLLALTHRQTDRQTDRLTDRENTLALRGLEEPAHALHGLEEPFFQLCCCVSFWFWREIIFGCTYYNVLGVPYSCGVVLVFWFWWEIVFGVTYVLSVQYICAVVSVFLLWRESFITTGKKSSSRLSGGLCCCVSFWFWREMGKFFVVAGKFYYDRKKKF